jgi:hypothetical protein
MIGHFGEYKLWRVLTAGYKGVIGAIKLSVIREEGSLIGEVFDYRIYLGVIPDRYSLLAVSGRVRSNTLLLAVGTKSLLKAPSKVLESAQLVPAAPGPLGICRRSKWLFRKLV